MTREPLEKAAGRAFVDGCRRHLDALPRIPRHPRHLEDQRRAHEQRIAVRAEILSREHAPGLGGAHVSIDALGHPETCFNSIQNLRRRGRHVQVGLMPGDQSTPRIPMAQVIGHELEIYGSHGMQAWRYDAILEMIEAGRIAPGKLIGRRISMEDGIEALIAMDSSDKTGISVITGFA